MQVLLTKKSCWVLFCQYPRQQNIFQVKGGIIALNIICSSRAAKHVIFLDKWNGSKFFKSVCSSPMGMKGQNLESCHCCAVHHRGFFFSCKLVGLGTFSDHSLNSESEYNLHSQHQTSQSITSLLAHHQCFLVPCPLFLPLLFPVSHCNFPTFVKHFILVPIFCHPIDSLSCSLYCQHFLRSR